MIKNLVRGSVVTVFIVASTQRGDFTPVRLALSGAAVSAFFGATLSANLIYVLARKKGAASPLRILFTGIVINAGLSVVLWCWP